MATATVLLLLCLPVIIYGDGKAIQACGEELSNTLSLFCNGSFNDKRSHGMYNTKTWFIQQYRPSIFMKIKEYFSLVVKVHRRLVLEY